MSNPVVESIASWQADATGADSNLPNSNSNAGIGTSQDLSGNLRLLKSEMRAQTLNKSWEIWLGLKNLANTANIAFTYITQAQFSVNDSFVDPTRNVAVVGRRVKAILAGSTIYGTIVAAVFTTVTTITVTWDSGALDATLSDVQFGPEPRARSVYDATSQLFLNAVGGPLTKGDVVTVNPSGDDSVVSTQDRSRQYVVALQNVPTGQFGEFRSVGRVIINVNGPVTRGHYLVKDAAPSQLAVDSTVDSGGGNKAPDGAFAVAMTPSFGGIQSIVALLLGSTVTPLGAHAATHLASGSDPINGVVNARVAFFKENGLAGDDLTLGPVGDGQILVRSGSFITSTGLIGVGNLKTATGSTSVSGVSDADVALNDYSFFPSFTSSGADRTEHHAFYDSGDPGDTVARFHLTINPANTHVIRWRYMTASDNPQIWVAYDNATGAIKAVWASDDPIAGDKPGLVVPGCTITRFMPNDLGGLDFRDGELDIADAFIAGNKLNTQNRFYRALQAKGTLPSTWILQNCSIAKDGRLRMGKVPFQVSQQQNQRKIAKAILADRADKIMSNQNLPQALKDFVQQVNQLIDE